MGNENAIDGSDSATEGIKSAIDGSVSKDEAWGVFCMRVLKNIHSLH
ncbi:hypothetical protein ABMX69_10980 [Vibrio vulnificus]